LVVAARFEAATDMTVKRLCVAPCILSSGGRIRHRGAQPQGTSLN
jgi:hypothetical protein